MEAGLQPHITSLVSQLQKGGEDTTVILVPLQPPEEGFEEMTVEVDVNTIKGSPLDQDSVPSVTTDDDSQQSITGLQTGGTVVVKGDNEVTFSVMTPCEVDSNYSNDGTVKDSDGVPLLIRKPRPGKPVFVCEVCNKTFEKRSRLVSHMLTHTNEKTHICPICNKGFKNKSQLQRHNNTHSEVPRFCCNICGRGFKHNDVAKHIRRFHCGPRKSARGGVANPHSAQFNTAQPQHSMQQPQPQQPEMLQQEHHHHQQQQQPQSQQPQSHAPQLHHPHHSTNSRQHRVPHEQRFEEQQLHHGEQSYQEVHQEIVLQVEGQEAESGEDMMGQNDSNFSFPCPKCNKSFSKRSGLASHMMVHQRTEDSDNQQLPCAKSKHQCPICLKTFTRASGLNSHVALHSRTEKRREPNPDFRCHICGKMFTRRTGLNAHVLQHGGVLRFWCNEPDCGKGFVHSYQMTRHKRSHSDVLPYTCTVCGKSFRHNDLSKHMRIHTGVKPYNCQHCGKAFAFSSSLRTHERMHLAVREHICEVCNTGFTTAAGLRRHVKSHDEEKSESCSFCGKEFTSSLFLSLHLQESQHCAEQQQVQRGQLSQASQVQVQQVQVQQLQVQDMQQALQQVQHVQQLPQVHEVHIEVPQHPHPVALHIAQGAHAGDHPLVPDQDQEATLATLTAPNPAHVQVRLPVTTHASATETEQATISSPANVGALPVLVPFSVSVPISVPFGINLNGTGTEQLHLNHFLSWEQKF